MGAMERKRREKRAGAAAVIALACLAIVIYNVVCVQRYLYIPLSISGRIEQCLRGYRWWLEPWTASFRIPAVIVAVLECRGAVLLYKAAGADDVRAKDARGLWHRELAGAALLVLSFLLYRLWRPSLFVDMRPIYAYAVVLRVMLAVPVVMWLVPWRRKGNDDDRRSRNERGM